MSRCEGSAASRRRRCRYTVPAARSGGVPRPSPTHSAALCAPRLPRVGAVRTASTSRRAVTIERCVSNAKRPLLWYRRRHEAEGDGGGVGAAAATGDGVAGERTLARDRRAHGGGGVQRRLAVAGGGASAWCGGVGAETRPGSAAEIDGAATRALAAAARPRGARPRVRDRSLDDQAGSDGDHA